MLVLRRDATEQPTGAALVAQDNPSARGLVFDFCASESCVRNSVIAAVASPLGTGVTFDTGKYGKQLTFNGSQGLGSCSFGTQSWLLGATEATWEILFYLPNANSTGTLMAQWDGGNQNWLVSLSAGKFIWVAADDAGSGRSRFDSTNADLSAAGWYHAVLSWRGGSTAEVLLNGLSRAMTTVSSSATGITGTMDNWCLGNRAVTGSDPVTASIVFARAWRRGLARAEMDARAANLWSMYE